MVKKMWLDCVSKGIRALIFILEFVGNMNEAQIDSVFSLVQGW